MKDIRIDLLEKVIKYEGTEYGETLHALLNLEARADLCSDDLRIAIDKEIQLQYEWCRDNLVFEETEEVITRKVLWVRHKDDHEEV